MRHFIKLALLASLALRAVDGLTATATASDDFPSIAKPAITHHHIRIESSMVSYAATAGETALKGRKGLPAATIFSTAYVREGAGTPAKRPVLFLFNGGPGQASYQFQWAFGPVRSSRSIDVNAPADTPRMVDNPYSLIDAVDLVFIDPVGTGYSRLLPGGEGANYWSIAGDAHSMLTFIRVWLRTNKRTASPTFICGESYGGVRLATMLKNADNLKLAGVLFLSPLLDATASLEPTVAADAPGNDLPYIFSLPTMAADAWYHNRIDRQGRTVEETFREARAFAGTEYSAALYLGSQLAEPERQRVAHNLAIRIGIPEKVVLKNDLRVPVAAFTAGLLSENGVRIGQLDGRYTALAATAVKKRPPYDDPSMMTDESLVNPLVRYLTEVLKYHTDRPYVGFSLDVNLHWNWSASPEDLRTYFNVAPDIGAAMQRNSGLRLFLASGYYDLSTPLSALIYALDHAHIPPDRTTAEFFESGHGVYRSAESNKALSDAIRLFIGQ
jgi:carboxypeptidase C (cathepsin A)